MVKQIKNKPASIKAKLLNISREHKFKFQLLLLRYFQERFLYRLSISEYKDSFILKGGLLLIYLDMPKSRPTKDIDFLSNVSNDKLGIKDIIKKIVALDIDDGVSFCRKTIKVEDIIEEAKYLGCRVNVEASLGQAKTRLQVDIGFGDKVVPRPKKREITTILKQDKFKIKTYPIEVVISEKFEAMISLALINSRMKDFYDIYMISKRYNINGKNVKKALHGTCKKRGTLLTEELVLFNKTFYEDVQKNIQWNAFIRKFEEIDIDISFEEIVKDLQLFFRACSECYTGRGRV